MKVPFWNEHRGVLDSLEVPDNVECFVEMRFGGMSHPLQSALGDVVAVGHGSIMVPASWIHEQNSKPHKRIGARAVANGK
jgi:hypothetical protein